MTERTSRRVLWLSLLVFGCLLAPGVSAAAPGVHAKAVVFGQSACFSGPNRQLGIHYRAGLLAAFAERNAKGGVNGRSLELISLDDGYEPKMAAANAERFASKDDVLAVIGGVGTPTAKRIVPVLRAAGIPFVGHITGADFLGDFKRNPHVVNLRASYLQELRAMVDHVVRKRGKKRFGILYQDDAFGRSVLKNYQTVLREHGLHILAKSAFSRNTHAVHAGLFILAKADLDAILIVGPYAANAEIINLANGLGHDYIIGNLSFVLSSELRKRIEAPSDRILVTEVMPNPTDTKRRIVRSYQRALRAASEREAGSAPPMFNELSLEGYILGRFVITVLERLGDEWTRERFLQQALASGVVLIDDWAVEFQPGTNVGAKFVRLTDLGQRIDGGRGRP
ncbi:MAG: ABC transporter substrate-binding protein [Deltaproteobacteria bacterium]|nr:ABC transporter substrate-binding protein [Deltaproteobacteria bacterium]